MVGKNASVRVAIVSDNSSLMRGLDQSESRLSSFGKGVAKAAAAAGAAAAVGLGLLAKVSIDAASQAQQSMGATETVFGKFARSVVKTSNGAATALGVSANAYRENANVLGALLANQGVSADKLAGKTRGLIKTGADLAATFGGTTTEAVEALASAFKGEFDPLEKYGVSIKQAGINTEAMRVAGVDTTAAFNELTDAQQAAAKQTALTNMLTKQTAKTQGAFAKETDTLAHQQQVLGAQWEDLKAKIGKALLPAVTNLFGAVNDDLMPALSELAGKWLPKVGKALDKWTRDLDVEKLVTGLGDALADIDWNDVAVGAGDIGDSFGELGRALRDVDTDGVNDGFRVFGVTIGFLADHVDLLVKAIPYIVTGFALWKAAQLANSIAGRDSLIGLGLQLLATRQLTLANRELALAMQGVARAQGVSAGSMSTATTNMSKFGAAAKGAAGLAGVGALAVGASTTNDTVGTLVSTLGGAATGFAVGGPVGAAVGGLAGLFMGLASGTKDAADEAVQSVPKWDALRSSLDSVTGAVTDQTKAELYEQLLNNGTLATLEKIGVAHRDVISAISGDRDARQRLNSVLSGQQNLQDQEVARLDALRSGLAETESMLASGTVQSGAFRDELLERVDVYGAEIDALDASTTARQTSIDSSKQAIEAIRAERRERLLATKAITDYTGKLKGLPAEAKTQIKAEGVIPTTRAIAKLAERYKLHPKQITTLIKATGADTTVDRVKRVQDALRGVQDVRPDLSPALKKVTDYGFDAKREALDASTGIADKLKEGTRKAKPDFGPFTQAFQSSLSTLKTTASTGGEGVGASLKTGALAGMSGLGAALSASMASAVRQAINAGRAEADAHSPSRETEKLGKDLAAGLIVGITKGSDGVDAALRKLTDRVTKTMDQQLAARQRDIRKRLSGKAEAAALKASERRWKAHAKAVKRALSDEIAALRANGKAQDQLGAKLDKARDKLREITDARASYAESIRASAVDFASVVGLDVGFNPKVMLAEMEKRLGKIRQFNAILTDLASKGLSGTIIDQLAQAGVEGGLATALAIQHGGQAAIDAFTKLQDQIDAAAGTLATTAADELYAERVAQAEKRVKDLEKRVRQMERQARRLLRQLAQAIRGELGANALPGNFSVGQVSPPRSSSATPKTTGAVATAAPVGVTYQITVNAPVGSSPADIGRQITTYIDAYEKAGGRRRT